MNEKAVPFRVIEPGAVVTQGRGGQSIVQDTLGNIILTTPNTSGSDQTKLSSNDAISSITLLSGETPNIIGTKIDFPSNNFNTINYEQTPVGGVQVVQPVYNVTTQSLNTAVDILPTSSKPQQPFYSTSSQLSTEIPPLEEQILFLPESETEFSIITEDSIIGIIPKEIIGLSDTYAQIKSATSGSCTTSYKEFKFQDKPSATLLTYTEAKKYLKSKYSDSIAKAVFAILWAEASKNGAAFRSPGGYNYAGVQTDSGRWPARGIIGQFCTRDAVRYRAFAIFESNKTFLDFMADRIKSKGFDGTTANSWARTYLNSWVYFNLEGQNKKLFNETLPAKIAIYNTAIRNFNS